MIRTVLSAKKVPSAWIFQYYCGIKEKLYGQDLKIKSIFTIPEERTASMSIFFNGKDYRFKDYSSGKGGDAINLVMFKYNLRYQDAVCKILDDYKVHENDNQIVTQLQKQPKFEITSYNKRKWNELDAKFWTQFGIGSKLLEKFNVFPLSEYIMTKETEGRNLVIHRKTQYIYGYFKSDGELYKLYQPMRDKFKFLNLLPYVQGSEQLTYSAPTLIICSSLKDTMSLEALNFNVESVAPSSENSMLQRPILSSYALKYKEIYTLFDNDLAGHNAMEKYQNTYGIPGIYLNLSKDLSDSIRDFGLIKTKQYLRPLIL